MEKQSKNIDRITKNIIKEGGLDQPSPNFFTNVMKAVEDQTASKAIVYNPLISKRMWILLITLTVVTFGLLFVFPVFSETSLFSQLTILSAFKLNFNLPEVNLSKTTVYGIGFLSLFLIQIPFLKRQLEKSYL